MSRAKARFEAWARTVRYETERWPLWRLDRDAAYLAKSLGHVTGAETRADAEHVARASEHLRAWVHARLGAAPELEPAFTLAAFGDAMWLRSGWARAASPAVRAELDAADLVVGNLETPVDPSRPVPRLRYETFAYNAPPAYLRALGAREGSATALSLCNNHALDQGLPGLRATRDQVRAAGFAPIGGPDLDDAIALVHVGAARRRVAIVAFTFGINGLPRDAPGPAGVPVHRLGEAAEPDWRAIEALFTRARALGPELVVCAPHWGFEYERVPGARLREHALRLVTLGADVITGSSPHVLGPVELASIDGFDDACPSRAARGGPPKLAVIAYSLGNFATIMPTLPCRVGALLHLEYRDGARGIELAGVTATPTYSRRGVRGPWLDGGVVAARELAEPLRSRALEHARASLGL